MVKKVHCLQISDTNLQHQTKKALRHMNMMTRTKTKISLYQIKEAILVDDQTHLEAIKM